jgi:hypothetical protein
MNTSEQPKKGSGSSRRLILGVEKLAAMSEETSAGLRDWSTAGDRGRNPPSGSAPRKGKSRRARSYVPQHGESASRL